nr:MAG TPA: hypothetical protein [Caudoviricetes sp.]
MFRTLNIFSVNCVILSPPRYLIPYILSFLSFVFG